MIINVGKAVLYQMLGVQPNHKSMKDILKISGNCSDCPWLMAATSHPTSNTLSKLHYHCNQCPFKGSCPDIDMLSVDYVNERNRFGNKRKVCRNAILFFILLHTMNPSKNGFIKEISLSSISKKMNVNVKTVYNCVDILVKNEYIYADKISAGTFNIILLDYPSYFLKADKGGRGFLKLSEDVIDSLLNIHSILAFRLILRQLLESDKVKDSVKSYKELRLSLPAYCKRNVIMSKMKDYCSSIYDIVISADNISFVLRKDNDTYTNYEKEIIDHEMYFRELLDMLDDFVLSYSPGIYVPNKLKCFMNDNDGNTVTPVLFQMNGTSDVTNILAKLSCKYSRQIVTDALADTYRLHMCKNKGLIKNIGAYILEVIRSYGLLDGKPSEADFSKIDICDSSNLVVA